MSGDRLVKKIILLLFFGFVFAISSFADSLDVDLLMFSVNTDSTENVDFMKRRVPDIIYNYLMKDKHERINYALAWNKSSNSTDWVSLSDFMAVEFGKMLSSNYVISGNVTIQSDIYSIEVFVYDMFIKRRAAEIKLVSSSNEDLYTFLERVSISLQSEAERIVELYLDKRVTATKLSSFSAALGYPIPMGDMINLQIGLVSIDTTYNLTYRLWYNENLSLMIRSGIGLGTSLYINNPQKNDGFFAEIDFYIPVLVGLDLYKIITLYGGIGFLGVINIYSYSTIFNGHQTAVAFAPGLSLWLDGEIPLNATGYVLLGFRNRFDFSFYSNSIGGVTTKIQYKPSFYVNIRLEAGNNG